MNHLKTLAFGAALAGAGGVAVGAPGESGPVAVYWMSVSTTTGMGGMMGGGGQRPNMAQMMNGGFNPNAANRTLTLQLGSERHPDGDPTAEHDPPPGLLVGPMLPLVTPQAQPVHEEHEPGPPPQYRQPQGRMLIFWGCGEHAGSGQPVVIDFASMGTQAGAERMGQMMHAIAFTAMQPPSPGTSTTYGEWPNQQSSTAVPADGSLQGEHVVKGDYTPAIQFTLGADQDFMPPFQLTQNQRNPSGSATLAWQPMSQARGFFAGMFGSAGGSEGGGNQIVMWTSSETQAMAFGMPDYLSNGEIDRLVASHVLMPASQTECTVPQEAVQAAGRSGFFTMTAYGGEVNFAYPDRPPPPRPWHVDWTVKVRYRSATSGILGMDMSRMGQMGEGAQNDPNNPGQQQPQQQQQQHHQGLGGLLNGLGGFIP